MNLNAPVMLSEAKHLAVEQKVFLDAEPQVARRFQVTSQILRLRLRMTRRRLRLSMTAEKSVSLNITDYSDVPFFSESPSVRRLWADVDG